jgi:Ca2+/H+ antiporter
MAVLSFALFVVTIAYGIFSKKQAWQSLALACAAPLITYYVYRLLFSMCVKSL